MVGCEPQPGLLGLEAGSLERPTADAAPLLREPGDEREQELAQLVVVLREDADDFLVRHGLALVIEDDDGTCETLTPRSSSVAASHFGGSRWAGLRRGMLAQAARALERSDSLNRARRCR